ncbi:MAG: phage tail assembly chaperone [Christensenellales bacterium]|jgi:hypothetical protein
MAREKTNLPAEIFEEEAPVTEEEIKEEIVFNENELLKALTDETQHEDTIETIEVIFGKTKFSFRIRPLSEKEWDKCRERNTRYQKNRRLGGMRLPESTDTTGYHSDLIYTATLDEDKKKLWDNKRLWAAVDAVTGTDMVDKLIPFAGKKQSIIERIELLSGYYDDDEYNATVKN